jgi:hypothetical protein
MYFDSEQQYLRLGGLRKVLNGFIALGGEYRASEFYVQKFRNIPNDLMGRVSNNL